MFLFQYTLEMTFFNYNYYFDENVHLLLGLNYSERNATLKIIMLYLKIDSLYLKNSI